MKKILYLLLLIPFGLHAQNVPDVIRTTPIPATGANKNNRATVDANLKAMYALLLPRVTSNTINGAKDSSGYLFYNVITDRVVSARSMNVFDVLARVSDLNAYVPYNGATGGVNLKPYGMEASSYRAQQTNGIGVSYRLKTTNGLGDDWAIIGSQLGSPDGKQFRIAVADPTGGLGDLTVFSIDYDVTNPLPKFKFILEGITPLSTANNKQIPTTEWVKTAIAASSAGVSSFNGRTGAVTPLTGDYAAFYSDLTSSQSIGGVKTYTTGLRSSITPSVATDVVRLSDLGNYVTTNTNQTIATGSKTWTQNQTFQATALFNETNHTGQSLYESGSSIAYRSTAYTAGKWSFLMSNSDILFQKAGFTGGTGNMTDVQYLFGSDRLRRNGIALLETGDITQSIGANPTAQIGLTAVNGSAPTFMRSDAAPPVNQAIQPTWTQNHNFNGGVTFGSNIFASTNNSFAIGTATNNFNAINTRQLNSNGSLNINLPAGSLMITKTLVDANPVLTLNSSGTGDIFRLQQSGSNKYTVDLSGNITTYGKDNYLNTAAYGTLTALTKIPKEYADAVYLQSVGVAQGVTTTGGVNPTIGLLDITPRSVTMTNATAAVGGLSASSLYIQRNIADRSNAIRSYTGTTVDWIYGDDAVTGDWYIERYSGGSVVDRPFRLNKATGIPAFLYSPTMPTAATGDNTTKGASTAFVQQELTASGRTRAFLNSNITLALNGDYLSTTSTLYTGVLPPTTGFLTDGSKLIVVAATGTAGARISCPTGYTLVGLSGAATPGTGGVNIVNGGKVQLAPVGTNAYQYYALSGTVIVN